MIIEKNKNNMVRDRLSSVNNKNLGNIFFKFLFITNCKTGVYQSNN